MKNILNFIKILTKRCFIDRFFGIRNFLRDIGFRKYSKSYDKRSGKKISLESEDVRMYYNKIWLEKHDGPGGKGKKGFRPRLQRIKYILLRREINEFLSSCTHRGSRILDLGCGPGYIARLMEIRNENIDQYLGVDISDTAIKFAQDSFVEDEFFQFQVFDLNNLDQLQPLLREYNIVLAVDVLEHLSRKLAYSILDLIAKESEYMLINVPTDDSDLLTVPTHIFGLCCDDLNDIFTRKYGGDRSWQIVKSRVVKWNRSGDEILFIIKKVN